MNKSREISGFDDCDVLGFSSFCKDLLRDKYFFSSCSIGIAGFLVSSRSSFLCRSVNRTVFAEGLKFGSPTSGKLYENITIDSFPPLYLLASTISNGP